MSPRSETRAERSRERAIRFEYERKRRKNFITMITLLVISVGVPLLWFGAVEYGLVRAIQTQEFKYYLRTADLILFLAFLRTFATYMTYSIQDRKNLEEHVRTMYPST